MIPWVKSSRPSTSTSSSSLCIISSPCTLCPAQLCVPRPLLSPGQTGTWVHTQQRCSPGKELKYRTNKLFLFWKSPPPFKDCKATFLLSRKSQLNDRCKWCFSRALQLELFAMAGSLRLSMPEPQRIKANSPSEMQ